MKFTDDELGKLIFDIRCSPRGEEFWEAMREMCLINAGIELCTAKALPSGEVVAALDPTLNISPTYIALVMGKNAVFRDLERWSRHGEDLCSVKGEAHD